MPCAYLTDGPLVVAVDSSTQSTKAIIVDGAGNVLSAAKRKIELLTPAMAAIEAHAPHTPTGPDVATSAKAMAQFGQTIEPNPQMHARYQPIAAIQSQLYQQLRQTNANLDQLRTNQNA